MLILDLVEITHVSLRQLLSSVGQSYEESSIMCENKKYSRINEVCIHNVRILLLSNSHGKSKSQDQLRFLEGEVNSVWKGKNFYFFFCYLF